MLLQFTVENHLSFRGPVTLSMLAPEGATGPTVRGGARPTLTCAAVYGANASGKSNLVKALRYLVALLTEGVAAGTTLGATPFRLDEQSRVSPTRFQLDVQLAEGYFAYGLAITNDAVLEEWLVKDDVAVFERAQAGAIAMGDAVPAGERELWEFVARSTRSQQPFLHQAEDKNIALVSPLSRWLRRNVRVVLPGQAALPRLASMLHSDPDLRAHAERSLRGLGTGIARIVPVESAVDSTLLHLLGTISDAVARQRTFPTLPSLGPDYDATNSVLRKLEFEHEGGDGKPSARFTINDESDGTLRALELAPISYAARTDPGSPLFVIDELDRSLHPLLSRALLREFIDAAKERELGPQLLFTTHDTSLLSADLLDPASVWFTEKDKTGASSLYSLAEFDPAQLEKLMSDLEQGYLNGRFGAIPFVADQSRLGWKT